MHVCTHKNIAIIQPDNHSHFHEKGECEKSEHIGPSICCTMWFPPRREGETGRSQVWLRERRGDTLIKVHCFENFVYIFSALFYLFFFFFLPLTHLVTVSWWSTSNHRHQLSTKQLLWHRWGSNEEQHQQQQQVIEHWECVSFTFPSLDTNPHLWSHASFSYHEGDGEWVCFG